MKRHAKTEQLLNQVSEILFDLSDYWPLTLRQVYYQLVSRQVIENRRSQYQKLSGLLARAREEGLISWETIEDRTRVFHNLSGWTDSRTFINSETKYFLNGYRRDLLQSQDKYLEIWIEKDALSRIFTQTAGKYTVPVVVCRGFSSASFLNQYTRRAMSTDREPVILYFGDLDPSGIEIPRAIGRGIEKLGLTVTIKRCALLPDDITRYQLPHDPDALKETDTRAKRYISLYGRYAVELDALHPADLIDRIDSSITQNLNLSEFQREQEKQEKDLENINKIRERALTVLGAA